MCGATKIQTFLPYPKDFERTALCLDYRRLGNQRMEALVVLQTCLSDDPGGWQNHPCVKMWKGHEYTLARYGHTLSQVWASKGYTDNLGTIFAQYLGTLPVTPIPEWLDNPFIRKSHRSNLVRKLPSHYRQYWPRISDDLPYWWPTQKRIKLRVRL